jgi:hypothetical protein
MKLSKIVVAILLIIGVWGLIKNPSTVKAQGTPEGVLYKGKEVKSIRCLGDSLDCYVTDGGELRIDFVGSR